MGAVKILSSENPEFKKHDYESGISRVYDELDGYVVTKVLTLSSDSHIHREGLPTFYNRFIHF